MTPYARKLVFRIIPLSFTLGAGIEWFMLRVQIGRETFCESRPFISPSSTHILTAHPRITHLAQRSLAPATTILHAPSSGPSQPGLTHSLVAHTHRRARLLDDTYVRLESEKLAAERASKTADE
jgi:hypothetical protein